MKMVEQSRHVFMSCMYVRDVRTMVLLECTVLEYVLEYVLREYAYTRVPACVTAAIPVCMLRRRQRQHKECASGANNQILLWCLR